MNWTFLGTRDIIIAEITYPIVNPLFWQSHVFCRPKFQSIPTGCKSDIWKKVQVNIYCIYIGTTETNDISAETP